MFRSANFYSISNSNGSAVSINSNLIANAFITGIGDYYFVIANAAAANTLSINDNTIRNFSITNSTGSLEIISTGGAISSSISIDNNKLGDTLGGLVTYTVASNASIKGILNSAGTSTATLSIQNNDIRGIVHAVAGSGSHTYIQNSAATLSQNISSNTFTNLTVNTTGNATFIYNRVGLPAGGIQNINNNRIVTGYAKTGAGGVITLLLADAISDNNATIINSENNFSNMIISGASNFWGWQNNSASSCSKTISNNVFENWTVGSGNVQVLEVGDAGVNKTNVFNNTINNINALNGAIKGIYLDSFGGVLNCYGNALTNFSCSSTTLTARLDAISLQTFLTGTSNLPNNINNNTISNLYNAGGVTRGIGVSSTGIETNKAVSIYNNTISNISSDGAVDQQLFGMSISNSKNGNIYNNKIYNIASNGVYTATRINVVGILFDMVSEQNWNVYNNLIADLRAPNISSTDNCLAGVFINDTNPIVLINPSLIKFYYNSIYLNASSTGSDFGTTGIYHGDTGVVLDMRNNIISNTSTASGIGKTTALKRSSSGTSYGTTYSASSNNNLLYAGVPSDSNNLLSPDGTTTSQTLAELQANLAPRESNTTSGAVSFLSLDGTSSDFLRPDFTNAATSALIKDKATPISSITADFVGVTRGTLPDIGAYEFFGTTSAVVSAYDCNTASVGTMTAGTAVSGVTQTITATVTTVGTYTISAVANGVTFAGTGTFEGTGAQDIVLTAAGTPTAVGSHTFTLNTTPNCSFSRTTL